MLPYLDNNHKIPAYGLMIILGIGACFLVAIFCLKNFKVKTEDRIYSGCFALIGGILGAKLLSIFTSIKYIRYYNLSIYDVIKNGFVFYGGLIGGAAGLLIYAKMYKIKVADIFDFAAVCLPLGQVFGRIGCFLAGCCFGHPTDSFLGVTYTISLDPNTPLNISILPVQLFESAYCLLIFTVLMFLSRKRRFSGLLTSVYAISYGACRFINEFFRYDLVRGFLFGLSTSQLISIAIVVAATIFLCVTLSKKRRMKKEIITL